MRKINYVAGYYEWHLLVDDQLVWVQDDGDIDSLYENTDYMKFFNGQILASDLEGIIDGIVDYLRYDVCLYREDEQSEWFTDEMFNTLKSLTDEEWEKVKETIFIAYCWHYCVYDRRFKYNDIEFEAVGNLLGNKFNISPSRLTSS